MKYLYAFLLSLSTIFTHAQNLVPNYSFEESDSCPTNYNTRTYEYSLGCIEWGQATTGTVDYFNECDTLVYGTGNAVPVDGIPNNTIGYQKAYDGKAYCGIITYQENATYYKEYLIATIPALQHDTAYHVSIHVSLADSSHFATDGLGVLFTTYGTPSMYGDTTILKTPQVDYTNYGVISDTANWTTLSGTFVADSDYTSIIIGGFKKSADMHLMDVNDSSKKNSPRFAYYYIDDVIVEKLSTTGIINHYNANTISVYPNPFTNCVIISFNIDDYHGATFKMYNSQGQLVQTIDNIQTDSIRIERNGLPVGVYYYLLRTENIMHSGKVVII